MNMSSLLDGLIGNKLARKCADFGFGWYARRRAAQLNRSSVMDIQRETLLRLVRFAQNTRFGREHDFAGVYTVADYQERVPLRDYEAFWTDYWQQAYPTLQDITWPGRIPYFALSSGTTSGTTKYIPVSHEMMASNQKAALTSLAWFRAAHPEVPLFTGRLFFLGAARICKVLGRIRPCLPATSAASSLGRRPQSWGHTPIRRLMSRS